MPIKKLLITPANVLSMRPELAYYEGHQLAVKNMLKTLDGIIDLDTGLSDAERMIAVDIRNIVKRMSR